MTRIEKVKVLYMSGAARSGPVTEPDSAAGIFHFCLQTSGPARSIAGTAGQGYLVFACMLKLRTGSAHKGLYIIHKGKSGET